MSAARYLLRFDDICPTMNWQVWSRVEELLRQRDLRPILAVVPDNRDPVLEVSPPNRDFWAEVRRWQELGWCIGLHGYQHRTLTLSPGMMGITHHSEFAEVPESRQRSMIAEGLEIFRRNRVVPKVWVAPAHSFDKCTTAILERLGLMVISDGWFTRPGVDRQGLLWLPQQLWCLKPKSFGVWTVCYHVNKWTERDLESFARDLDMFAGSVTDFDAITAQYANRRLSVADWALFVPWKHWYNLKARCISKIMQWWTAPVT